MKVPKPRGWGRVPVVTRSVLPLALLSSTGVFVLGAMVVLLIVGVVVAAVQARKTQRRAERLYEIRQVLKLEEDPARRKALAAEMAALTRKQRRAARGGDGGSWGGGGCGGCGGCSGCGGCGGCGG